MYHIVSLHYMVLFSVLSCLHERYDAGLYYTGAGSTVVAVNPFKDVPCLYETALALSYHTHEAVSFYFSHAG